MKYIDLHVHTAVSDGTFTPSQTLDYAKKIGLSAIAITDHDRIEGLTEAKDYSSKIGIEFIPGIELTTFWNGVEVHILGYYIDHQNPVFDHIIKYIDLYRESMIKEMITDLLGIGIDITFDDIKAEAGGTYLSRTCIALAMVNKGYILHTDEAFSDKYIGDNGRFYRPSTKLTPKEAIDIIKKAGGLPVLAHPAYFKSVKVLLESDIRELMDMGIEGIEVWHTRHTEQEKEYYLELARKLNLAVTGGSDCHGTYYDTVWMGNQKVPYSVLENLEKLRK
ncbi:PHP domain-containing protein [bacterium]|nr:PHP domain-containing protein [bacterium]